MSPTLLLIPYTIVQVPRKQTEKNLCENGILGGCSQEPHLYDMRKGELGKRQIELQCSCNRDVG